MTEEEKSDWWYFLSKRSITMLAFHCAVIGFLAGFIFGWILRG